MKPVAENASYEIDQRTWEASGESAALAKINELEAEVARLLEELSDTRRAHGKLMRRIKQILGLDNWPTIEGNFVDGVGDLLEAEVARLEGACRRAINLLREEGDEGLALSIESAIAAVAAMEKESA